MTNQTPLKYRGLQIQILGWKNLVSSHQFIQIVNGSTVIPFIFNVIFLKEEILLHLWRYPSLSIHGIEGAFHEPGIKTVIPAKVIGKFSIRQVPHMDLSVVKQQVKVKPFLWPLLCKLSPS